MPSLIILLQALSLAHGMFSTWFKGTGNSPEPSSSKRSSLADSGTTMLVRKQMPIDLVAEMLTLQLQKQMVDFDDYLASEHYKRRYQSPPNQLVYWRGVKGEANCGLQIKCYPEGSFFVPDTGVIHCWATVQDMLHVPEGSRPEPIYQKVASYGMLVAKNVDPELCRLFDEMTERQAAQAKEYNEKAASGVHPFSQAKAFFESTSMARRQLSPFHPECSSPWMTKIRLGPSEEVDVKLVLLSEVDGGVGLPEWLEYSPITFYRLLGDIELGLPAGCKGIAPVPFDPPSSPKMGDQVMGHLNGLLEFFDERCGVNRVLPALRQWKLYCRSDGFPADKDDHAFGSDKMVQLIIGMVKEATSRQNQISFVDCSHPLPLMTGSRWTPPTSSVVGVDLFTRVMIDGAKPGLWMVVRGQNPLKSTFDSVIGDRFGSVDSLFQSNQEFSSWLPGLDAPESLQWCKFQIRTSFASIFVIVLWDNDLERYANLYPPPPPRLASMPLIPLQAARPSGWNQMSSRSLAASTRKRCTNQDDHDQSVERADRLGDQADRLRVSQEFYAQHQGPRVEEEEKKEQEEEGQ